MSTHCWSHDETTQLYQQCTTWDALLQLNIRYLLNELPCTPTYSGAVNTETHAILHYLIQLNKYNIVYTVLSQPGVYNHEFNVHTRRIDSPQRTFVQGYTTQNIVKQLKQAYYKLSTDLQADLHICIFQCNDTGHQLCLHNPSDPCSINVTQTRRSVDRVQCINISNSSALQYKQIYNAGSYTCINQQLSCYQSSLNQSMYHYIVGELYCVTVIDKVYGRKYVLWNWLIDTFINDK